MKIFLDMDGVICDYFTACLRAHNIDHIGNYENWPENPKMYKVMGISAEDYGDPIDNDFGENEIKFYDHTFDLLDRLKQYDVCLLTSPSRGCASGKQEFIRKYLPEFYNYGKYLIGPAKEFCASSDSLLIDDMDENIEKFQENGGFGVTFPQPGNSLRGGSYENFTDRLNIMIDFLKWRELGK